MIQIGTMKLESGKRVQGMLQVVNHDLELPVCAVCGRREGPVVLITAGIHGAEYIGIQTARELSKELDPEKISGTIVFLLVANPQAAFTYTRLFVPEDGKNLNRAFPGKKDGSLSQKIAYTIEHELHSQADYYIDLHAGDTHEQVMPFVYYPGAANEEVMDKSSKMAEATGMEIRVKSSATTGSYSYAAMEGVPSILIERGGGGSFTKDQLASYKKNVVNVLSCLGVISASQETEKENSQKEVINAVYTDSIAEGFWHPTRQPGERFLQGDLLGAVEDVWGTSLQLCHAEFDGIVLYETTAMGVSIGDSLIAYGECRQLS
ncbi:M14 family metallopeptidase [Lacrimispora amygdalina]|uniref:M14 family metallopeptidase n=1 Tax=Lacrimispora amygdalina TaxID=253257 RepID=UPI000BE42FAA|nr:M14 family metallopeptidase [Lacrimispora amygdalina]